MCRPSKHAKPHFFQKSLYYKQEKGHRRCPHCGSKAQPLTVQLKVQMPNMPVQLLQSVSKMSFSVKKSVTEIKKIVVKSGQALVEYKLPGGKVISSEGMPDGIAKDVLAKLLEQLQDKHSLKQTTRSMYAPVKTGDNFKILQMLAMGYLPDSRLAEADGGTPLHVAAAEGHVLTLHLLIQAGAELDVMNEEQNTALMLACINGKADCVKYLLKAGASVTPIGDDGMTCLHLATQSGHLECVHLILNQTNLPRNFLNLQDDGGWTPLVWACENKHEPVIK